MSAAISASGNSTNNLFVHARMRQGQIGFVKNCISMEKQIEIDRARAVRLAANPAQLLLDPQERFQHCRGRQIGLQLHGSVEVVGLIRRPSHGCSFVEPGNPGNRMPGWFPSAVSAWPRNPLRSPRLLPRARNAVVVKLAQKDSRQGHRLEGHNPCLLAQTEAVIVQTFSVETGGDASYVSVAAEDIYLSGMTGLQ